VAPDWESDRVVRYRLLTKEDFQAKASGKLWGNIAHKAEVCTNILSTSDAEPITFRSVMMPECSYWNKVIGPLGYLARAAAAVAGWLVIPGRKIPDWYVLQHEQIHFSIMEITARELTQDIAKLIEAVGGEPEVAIHRLYRFARLRAADRHTEFDGDTSGIYDPDSLETWVGWAESHMRGLCDREASCPVRQQEGH
jgi:hypothetical protein